MNMVASKEIVEYLFKKTSVLIKNITQFFFQIIQSSSWFTMT